MFGHDGCTAYPQNSHLLVHRLIPNSRRTAFPLGLGVSSRYTRGVRLFNKTFYKFFLGFLSVVTVTLFLVFIIGVSS